jgi:hypothetical protein
LPPAPGTLEGSMLPLTPAASSRRVRTRA